MIPAVENDALTFEEAPSKTWRLDLENGRIRGEIDGLAAVIQAAFLILQTPRYQHLIFSWQYGSELGTLIGRDKDYLVSEAKRMIPDALSTDSRITGVRDFVEENGVLSFTLDTIYGSGRMKTEAMRDGL